MPIAVEYVSLMRNDFRGDLMWNAAVGLDATGLNVQIRAFGDSLPRSVDVEVRSRELNQPNRPARAGKATLATPTILKAPFHSKVSGDPKRALYRLSTPVRELGSFLNIAGGNALKVATVARQGGTSDQHFRLPGQARWAFRGYAHQPNTIGVQTGSRDSETPDALKLFESGGLELLEVRVASQPGWKLPPPARHLIRSPADVFYYSGHGLDSGHLAVQSLGSHPRWLDPEDLVKFWPREMDLDVLILAGCHVLELATRVIRSDLSEPGPGHAWGKLLNNKNGPLRFILGYAGFSEAKAPSDEQAGNLIAAKIAARIAGGSREFVRDWLQVNWEHKHVGGINAVAMDTSGFWHLDPKTGAIQGPIAF